ncbi:MAG: RNA polymerase sigma factor [Proteobacteria bacterium]|nr:RNA polymerase sigma factor [Pseudomonadota bacterium]
MQLIDRHEGRLYNYCLRMTGNADDAMDVLQDVLLSVYRNLATFRGDGSFGGWMFRIASFRCADHLRRRMRRGQEEDVEIADGCAPTQQLDANREIQQMLQSISDEQRQVIELKFFQNFTFEEISGQLGISTNTAKSRVYRALASMRKSSEASVTGEGQ